MFQQLTIVKIAIPSFFIQNLYQNLTKFDIVK